MQIFRGLTSLIIWVYKCCSSEAWDLDLLTGTIFQVIFGITAKYIISLDTSFRVQFDLHNHPNYV